eukprot:jgi/Botrbrau1/11265/Bobra.0038s0037.1
MQYGTASQMGLYRYRRLRSGSIETPDRERAWQSIGCGIHLGSSSKLISVCSVLNDCLINCYLTHCNTDRLGVAVKLLGLLRAKGALIREQSADIDGSASTGLYIH